MGQVPEWDWRDDSAQTGSHRLCPPLVEVASNFLVEAHMIRKLTSGEYRLYSRRKNPKTGKRRNLGTFPTREKAEAHERAVQYFKRRG